MIWYIVVYVVCMFITSMTLQFKLGEPIDLEECAWLFIFSLLWPLVAIFGLLIGISWIFTTGAYKTTTWLRRDYE